MYVIPSSKSLVGTFAIVPIRRALPCLSKPQVRQPYHTSDEILDLLDFRSKRSSVRGLVVQITKSEAIAELAIHSI